MKNRRNREIIVAGMIEKINDEINIEIQDKFQMFEDGLRVEEFYKDDFETLKRLLQKDVEHFMKHLQIDDVIFLLELIDDKITDAMWFILDQIINENNNDRKGVTT